MERVEGKESLRYLSKTFRQVTEGFCVIVLGVDPGTAITGYGVVRTAGDRVEALDFGCIKTSEDESLGSRLKRIHDGVVELIRRYCPDMVAVEELFFSKNARTAMAVGEARGVVLLAAAVCGCAVREYTPMQVKQAVTGYGKADKRQVQAMVRTLLRLDRVPHPDDAADALAVAISCVHSASTEMALSSSASL